MVGGCAGHGKVEPLERFVDRGEDLAAAVRASLDPVAYQRGHPRAVLLQRPCGGDELLGAGERIDRLHVDRHDGFVCGAQRVDREEPEVRRAIDQDDVIAIGVSAKSAP